MGTAMRKAVPLALMVVGVLLIPFALLEHRQVVHVQVLPHLAVIIIGAGVVLWVAGTMLLLREVRARGKAQTLGELGGLEVPGEQPPTVPRMWYID